MMADQVRQFIKANDKWPVISGAAIEPNPNKPPRGAIYTLSSKRAFKLTPEELRALPDGYPKWKGIGHD
jgi:hypothetical protein